MPIITAELQVFRAANVSDQTTNGGRMSATEITSNVVGNVFPSVYEAERAAGSTKYRKVFFKNNHDGSDVTLLDSRVFMDKNSAGADKVTFFVGTQTNTQASVTGSERQYGCGDLDVTVAAAASSILVECETGNTGIFLVADTIRITDKTAIGESGNEETATISTVSVGGNIVTIGLSAPLVNGYSSANTRVASLYVKGDLKPTFDNFVVATVGNGDYNSGTYPVTMDNEGTIEQTWTLTFTSATVFNISGNTVGATGSGSSGAGASPTNSDFSKPYFTLSASGFSGTYAAADTIVFQTHPAAIPIWIKRVVPVAAATTAGSTAWFGFDGGTS